MSEASGEVAVTALVGDDQDRQAFTEVYRHYAMSNQDVKRRMVDWDQKDTLFRNYINPSSWPYRSMVTDPRIFTALYEKTARILANKPEGRLVPREGGDALGAKINNELLSFEWDDNERADGTPMLGKWALMDLNARKYGASFALCNWRWKRQVERINQPNDKGPKQVGKVTTFFDGPDFKPWPNRDVLHNPSYSTIKNWIILRDYLTLKELEDVNDHARSKPIYKNLDILKQRLSQGDKGGLDTRSQNYWMKNKTVKGLQDWLGLDPFNKIVEVCTEYRPDRWITFAPKHGIILRDIPNPYKHQQIPVVQLKYYPVDEDIYGLSEIEPVEKLQKAINALVCQYLDAINMGLYTPLKIRASGVQMHTLEFGPGKKWLMNDPATDVVPLVLPSSGVQEFAQTYRFLVGAMQEALGESSASASSLNPGQQDKTATEIRDMAGSRSARDNFNLIYLGEALKKQMLFWFKMNQQFLFNDQKGKNKVLAVTGKEALKYFQNEGLDKMAMDDKAMETLSDPSLAGIVRPEDLQSPLYPAKDDQGNMVPKLKVDGQGQTGHLIIEPGDLSGTYDYVPDVGSMSNMAPELILKSKNDFIQMVTGVNPKTGQPIGVAAMMQAEGTKIKATDLIIDYAEDIGFKNADQYVERTNPNLQQQMGQMGGGQVGGQINPGGNPAQTGGAPIIGNGANQGMAGGIQAVAGGQA